ncbi:ABC transporter permease [Pediococcus acidilactici]|nr:ABC transporter permease [Pediococcus acidilactici]
MFLNLASLVVFILVWLAITSLRLVSPVLLPSPNQVLHAFLNLIFYGYNGIPLLSHYLITIGRLAVAVFVAVIIGIPLGLSSGYLPSLSTVIDPIIQFIRPIPPLAYYTLLILWFGIGETSKITLLFFAALPPIYLSAYDAVRKLDREYLLSASSLGATKEQIFYRIVVPASLPDIFTGFRTAVGVAYTTIVSAEMIASSAGVGWMVIDASHYLKSDVIFVGIILLGVTGMLIDYLIRLLERRIVHWSGEK